MNTKFDDWLRALAAAQKGPVTFPGASRGRAYTTTVTLQGTWTGATMKAEVRIRPDAAGDPIASFTVTGPVIGVDVGGIAISTYTLSLSAAATGGFPPDSDLDGVEQFAVDVLLTPSGGDTELLFGGVLPLLGRITA